MPPPPTAIPGSAHARNQSKIAHITVKSLHTYVTIHCSLSLVLILARSVFAGWFGWFGPTRC